MAVCGTRGCVSGLLGGPVLLGELHQAILFRSQQIRACWKAEVKTCLELFVPTRSDE